MLVVPSISTRSPQLLMRAPSNGFSGIGFAVTGSVVVAGTDEMNNFCL